LRHQPSATFEGIEIEAFLIWRFNSNSSRGSAFSWRKISSTMSMDTSHTSRSRYEPMIGMPVPEHESCRG
jgi:hypothetical protein